MQITTDTTSSFVVDHFFVLLGNFQFLFLLYVCCFYFFFFFFQAEDGIRDADVTGVQTCALPIFPKTPQPSGRTQRPRAPSPSSASVRCRAHPACTIRRSSMTPVVWRWWPHCAEIGRASCRERV